MGEMDLADRRARIDHFDEEVWALSASRCSTVAVISSFACLWNSQLATLGNRVHSAHLPVAVPGK